VAPLATAAPPRGSRLKGERPHHFGWGVTQRLLRRGVAPPSVGQRAVIERVSNMANVETQGGSMPLIKPRAHRVRTLRHISRLQEPNRDVLVLCARFIGEPPDYVLNQLIETTLARDREFVAWRAEQTPPKPSASEEPEATQPGTRSGRPVSSRPLR
jgi:hypothetical protein